MGRMMDLFSSRSGSPPERLDRRIGAGFGERRQDMTEHPGHFGGYKEILWELLTGEPEKWGLVPGSHGDPGADGPWVRE